MKITIKSIKQVAYDVVVPSEETKVLELKAIIENTHNFDKTALKLLFNGTLLDDNKSLKEYSIKEGMSIIMMNVKAKPVNITATQSIPSNEEKKESNEKVTQSNQNKSDNKPIEKPITQEKDYSKEVKQLTEMGFSQEEAKNAIKAAKGNIEIAIEFLYNGIPSNVNDFDVPEDDLIDAEEGQESDPSTVLKNIASMVKIVSQGNPSQIQNLLVQLQQNNPELFELISENEEEFRNLLSKPLSQEDVENFQRFQQQGGLSAGDSEAGNNGNSSNETIRLSKPDYEAVQRLKALGFSEMDAVQAYFAFEKNEEMAANFLYESKFQEGEDFGNNNNQGSNQNNNKNNPNEPKK